MIKNLYISPDVVSSQGFLDDGKSMMRPKFFCARIEKFYQNFELYSKNFQNLFI